MRLIITFPTTTAALAWEQVCKVENLPGRLIPVPPTIHAECGLAWLTTPDRKEKLLASVAEFSLSYDQIYELDQ